MTRAWNPGMTCQRCRPSTHRSLDERGQIECPLWRALRTQVGYLARSEKCQEATYAMQHILAYSITSSARASSVGGTSRPSAWAVFKLMTSWYLVGACTGRSAGFSPLR